ncbi:hypothetical protein [Rachiplusia nu nucleopolyhedrovirus]|uniref:Uncharacterized protein n=1 Tax=Rachiplusia nu nucleopolyhedrovirus TaxID=2605775 RepID=A0AAE6IRE8_9ABAC|nr:hypothetical protein QKQ55_gp111 [Rachiplusia nu nucleopolyhedrovirus]QEI03694.1 hypothetical protein [Rachiplusia nu nucleopolyhedrovirus]
MNKESIDVYCEQKQPLTKEINWGGDITDAFSTSYLISPRQASISIMLTTRIASLVITGLLTTSAYYVAADKIDYFLYYSHWSLFLLFSYFTIASITSLIYRLREADYHYTLPWFVQLQWILYNVVCSSNLLTSSIYYIVMLVYKNNNNLTSPVNNVIHLFNSMLVIVEVFVSSIPVRLRDAYQSVVYTLFYGCFLATYHWKTGEIVYKFLNWSNQHEMLKLCACSMILLITIYVVLYTIHVIKVKFIKTII